MPDWLGCVPDGIEPEVNRIMPRDCGRSIVLAARFGVARQNATYRL
jgi:hypothetical protein